MKVDVSYKFMESSKLLDEVLEKNIQKVKKRLSKFPKEESVHLSIHIEKNPHKNQYFCRTHIYLPAKVIKAETSSDDSIVSINKSFSALLRQLDKLKHKLIRHLSVHKDKHLTLSS